MSQPPPIDLDALWKYVTDQMKTKVVKPGLWRAMEAARPLALENDELILGFTLLSGGQSGLLLDNMNRNTIEQIMEAATRRRLRIRVISGDTVQDWEAEKLHAAEAARLAQEARQQTRRPAGGDRQDWDSIGEQLVRKYSATQNRTLPSVQARFLAEALDTLGAVYPRLMENATETDERNFNRVIDRIAERTGTPHTMVAYLIFERVKNASSE